MFVGKYNPDVKELKESEFHFKADKIKWEDFEAKVEKKDNKAKKVEKKK